MMFSSILKKLREDSGLTQSELAQALSLTDATIGNYEQGLRKPRNDTLKAIAKHFNVSVDYLLGFENNTISISYNGSNPLKKEIIELINNENIPEEKLVLIKDIIKSYIGN